MPQGLETFVFSLASAKYDNVGKLRFLQESRTVSVSGTSIAPSLASTITNTYCDISNCKTYEKEIFSTLPFPFIVAVKYPPVAEGKKRKSCRPEGWLRVKYHVV